MSYFFHHSLVLMKMGQPANKEGKLTSYFISRHDSKDHCTLMCAYSDDSQFVYLFVLVNFCSTFSLLILVKSWRLSSNFHGAYSQSHCYCCLQLGYCHTVDPLIPSCLRALARTQTSSPMMKPSSWTSKIFYRWSLLTQNLDSKPNHNNLMWGWSEWGQLWGRWMRQWQRTTPQSYGRSSTWKS